MPRKKTKTELDENRERPDPMFKEVTALAARDANISTEISELHIQQLTSPDLLLTIPPNAKTENTLFDFFRAANVLEFKSASDRLTTGNFAQQMGRVDFYHNMSNVDFADLFNIVVTAYVPQAVLDYSIKRGTPFKEVEGRPWLLTARLGWQDVAIVLCDLLPREPRYAPWLLFASPRSETWREFVLMMARQKDTDMLKRAYGLSPKEFSKMTLDIKRIYSEYGPAEQARIRAEWRESIPDWLKEFSDDLEDILDVLTPEERLVGLKPEERLAGMKPEERLAGMKPEELEQMQKLIQEKMAAQQQTTVEQGETNDKKKQGQGKPRRGS